MVVLHLIWRHLFGRWLLLLWRIFIGFATILLSCEVFRAVFNESGLLLGHWVPRADFNDFGGGFWTDQTLIAGLWVVSVVMMVLGEWAIVCPHYILIHLILVNHGRCILFDSCFRTIADHRWLFYVKGSVSGNERLNVDHLIVALAG